MKKVIKILVLVILGAIAIIPGVTLLNSECAEWIKALCAFNMFFEWWVIVCLARINWWTEDNNESDGRTDWFSNKDGN